MISNDETREVVADFDLFLKEQGLVRAREISPGANLIHIIKHERNTKHRKKYGSLIFKPQVINCVVDKVTEQDAFVLLGERKMRKQVKQSSLYTRSVT